MEITGCRLIEVMHGLRKALFISFHGDPLARLGGIQSGGQNVYVRELALALGEIGWKVDVFTHRDCEQSKATERIGHNARVIRLAAGRAEFIPKNEMFSLLPAFVAELKSWARCREREYDIIFSNYWMSGRTGNFLRREWGMPQVHVSHSLGLVRAVACGEPVSTVRFREEKRVLQESDAVVASTPQEEVVLTQEYGAPSSKVRIIPCGVSPRLFRRQDRTRNRRQLGLGTEKVLLYVGRLERNKGLHVLLEAFAQLRQKMPQERLLLWVIGGDLRQQGDSGDAYARSLQKQVCSFRLADAVHFLGPVGQEKLPLYYGAASVCVVPSYYESFGLVAVEAMACGCPVVVSRTGGLRDTVEHGQVGFTVPPNNAPELAQALGILLSNQQLRERFSAAAAARITKRYTWPQIARQMAKLFAEVSPCLREGCPARTLS
jgi:D-inositol-3-phosphate glycosyltransferase